MIVNMRDGPGAQWLTSSIRFSLAESAAQRAGAGTVLAKLSELMFVEAIRRHIESLPPDQKGWFAGLRDRFVGKSLALMHAKPAHPGPWTSWRGRVGLSRSALAERFHRAGGRPADAVLDPLAPPVGGRPAPLGWRSVAAVGADVGYESEAAFNRAFKRELGVTPGGVATGACNGA